MFASQSSTEGWTIKLGVTRRTASPFSIRTRKVARLLKHPGFSSASAYSSDIALLLLADSVSFDEFLRPVCLPASSQIDLAVGTYCTVIGWGKSIHDEDADYLAVLHEVQVPIVSSDLCSTWYAKEEMTITDTMLCAGYAEGKKDACQVSYADLCIRYFLIY